MKRQNSPAIKLHILGSFELQAQGKVIHLPTRKMEALLAYLVLHPGVQNREKIASLFWGDSPEELARRSLRTALSAIRKELGEEFVLTDRETIQLNPALPVWVDVREIEKEAKASLSSDHSISSGIDIHLYRGDLLHDFYDDWVLEEREHYRTLFINTLLQLAQSLKTNGEYGRAIEISTKIISIDPVSERAYQQLIFCYGALGDRTAALRAYEECAAQLHEKLGVSPSADTSALYDQVKSSNAGGTGPTLVRSNLPIPLTSFIGREQELKSLRELFGKTRLLTLTGVGGCGKTRLSIELAGQLIDQFPDGVWWIELAAVQDEMLVAQTIKKTLGISDIQLASSEESITTYLGIKDALIVLDNCEHVITVCARLVEQILSQCPSVKILATSREALSIHGEIAWLVPSLSLPPSNQDDNLLQWESPRLFMERATFFRPDLQVDPSNAQLLLQICRAVEGIPLAIELAAARVKTLSLAQIASRIDDRLSLLTMGSRTAQPRQQTLRATIDWSYELLPEQEQIALRRLSILTGTWSLEAAESIASLNESVPGTTLDLITHLLDKSLLVAVNHDGEVRYGMLEIIRQYAHEKLQQANEVETIRDRHLVYFSELAQKANPGWFSRDQANLIKQFDAEYPNLRVALAHGLENPHDSQNLALGTKLASAVAPFWNFLAQYNEGQMWLKKAIDLINVVLTESGQGSPQRTEFLSMKARALYEYGFLVWFRSQYSQAQTIFLECAEVYKELDDPTGLAYAYIFLGHTTWGFGDKDLGRSMWMQGLDHFYKVDNLWGAAMIHSFLGRAEREATNYEEAEYQYNRCVELFGAVGDDWGRGIGLSHLGMLAFQKGDPIKARDFFEQRLMIAKNFGFKQSIAYATFLLGTSAWKLGHPLQTQKNMREALEYYYEMGSDVLLVECLLGLAWVEAEMKHFERAAYLLGAIMQTDETDRLRGGFENIFFHKPVEAWLQSILTDQTYQQAMERGRHANVYEIAEEILKE